MAFMDWIWLWAVRIWPIRPFFLVKRSSSQKAEKQILCSFLHCIVCVKITCGQKDKEEKIQSNNNNNNNKFK
jgi:hypothetical protein